jgi:hypothetical protein
MSTKGVGSSPGTPPSSGGLRKPTDTSQLNGPSYNPPRYAEWGGLDGATARARPRITRGDVGNPLTISSQRRARVGKE